MSAAENWRKQVESHHAQTKRAIEKSGAGHADLWSGHADGFRDDPRRKGDPVVELLSEWLTPESTVIDVGGGAGRYALPLALRCREVIVIEPSGAMQKALSEAMNESGIENVTVVSETWEKAEVEPADVVLAAHVVYGVTDIAGFVRKIDEKATVAAGILLGSPSPLSRMSPLWEAARQEKRIDLPSLPELLPVLREMGIEPEVTVVDAPRPLSAPTMDVALQVARHFLYITPGSDEEKRLVAAAPELLVETAGGVTTRGFSFEQAMVWWRK